jgi:hypothetical protein
MPRISWPVTKTTRSTTLPVVIEGVELASVTSFFVIDDVVLGIDG